MINLQLLNRNGETVLENSNVFKIFNAALKKVDPYKLVADELNTNNCSISIENNSYLNLQEFQNIYVVGCGKASWPMAAAVEDALGKKIKGGLAVTKYEHAWKSEINLIPVAFGGHPFPDQSGINATQDIIRILRQAQRSDLVLALLSGGGSSLLIAPVSPLSLDDIIITTKLLLSCGADIHEINVVRKHLSCISGGHGASLAFPARVFALVISDVIGDDLGTIASGPFFPDSSKFIDAINVLTRYNLLQRIPSSVLDYLTGGIDGKNRETPKINNNCFNRVNHKVIASNRVAIDAAILESKMLGYETYCIDQPVSGEARIAAKYFCSKVKNFLSTSDASKICVVGGGETTVTLGDNVGTGGRNQEFALAAALEIDGFNAVTVLSCGTDGTDGPTDAAGAIVYGDTIANCFRSGFDPVETLNRHDCYTLFNATGNLVKTGPTYTNVMDIQIAIIQR
jgi:glycerate-2-kinase